MIDSVQTNLNYNSKGFEKKNSSIITPKIKTGITFISVITVASAIWSLTAQIPIIVNVSGIMIPARGLFKPSAPSSGLLIYPFTNKNGKISFEPPSWSSQAYDYQWGNSDSGVKGTDSAISLAEKIVVEVAEDPWVRFSSVDVDENPTSIKVSHKSIIAIIEDEEARANLILSLQEYKNDLRLNSVRNNKSSQDLIGAKLLAQKNKEIFDLSKPLSPLAVSRTSLLQFEQAWLAEVAKIRSIEKEIILNDNELVEARKKVARALQSYLSKSMVYAFEDATINSFIEEQWATVNQGSELMTLSWSREVSPNTIPLFLDSSTFTQVSTGMDVILTPEGFNPAEVGGIKGIVESISPLPKDMSSLESTLGVSAAAKTAQESIAGNVYLAEVKLSVQEKYKLNKSSLYLKNAIDTKSDNQGGFVWNNNSNPPLPPRTGLKLNAQVITRYTTPAAMVLSFLREISGLETPSKLRKSS